MITKLHDIYLYKTDNFFHINHYLKSVSKVTLLHRFYCISYYPKYSDRQEDPDGGGMKFSNQ